jgi:hypothetical protein
VDLPLAQGEINAVERHDTREAFAYSTHGQNNSIFHPLISLLPVSVSHVTENAVWTADFSTPTPRCLVLYCFLPTLQPTVTSSPRP